MAKKDKAVDLKALRLEELVGHNRLFISQHKMDRDFVEQGVQRGITAEQFLEEMIKISRELSERFQAPY